MSEERLLVRTGAYTRASRSPFRRDIQALRALAVLLVVAYHAHLPGVHGGFLGVDVFFVISGFVITNVLLRERGRSGRTSLLDFYARRIRRILPAATVVIIATIFATYHWLTFYYGRQADQDAKWVAIFLGNFHFAAQSNNYLDQHAFPSTLQQFWSLAVEEQFYLLWPLLFGAIASVLPRVNLRAKLLVALSCVMASSLAWSIVQTSIDPNRAFYSPMARAWELALGCALAVGAPAMQDLSPRLGRILRAVGFTTLFVSVWLITPSTSWPGWAVIAPVVATGLVIAGGTLRLSAGFDRVTMLRGVQWIGLISYSLYLVHWPILTIARMYSTTALSLGANLELVAISMVAAALLYAVVERPFRRAPALVRRRDLTYRLGALLIGAAELCALATALVLVPPIASGAAQQVDPPGPHGHGHKQAPTLALLERQIARSVAIQVAPPSSATSPPYLSLSFSQTIWPRTYVSPCYVYTATKPVPPKPLATCSFGDKAAKRIILLTGDSQAGSWLAAFDQFGTFAHWRIVFMAMAKCAPWGSGASGGAILYNNVTAADCDRFRAGALAEARRFHPAVVALVGNGYYGSLGSLESQELHVARGYRAARSKVLFLRPVPQYEPSVTSASPVNCLLLHAQDVPACLQPPSVVVNAQDTLSFQQVAAKVHGAVINTTPLFCTRLRCAIYVFDGSRRRMINSDATHINYFYSAWIGRAFGQLLVPSLP